MLNRYLAEMERTDAYGTCRVVKRRRFKTKGRAIAWLGGQLSPMTCTRFTYRHELRRAPSGQVYDLKKAGFRFYPGKRVAEVLPVAIEVPACGDMIWGPQ